MGPVLLPLGLQVDGLLDMGDVEGARTLLMTAMANAPFGQREVMHWRLARLAILKKDSGLFRESISSTAGAGLLKNTALVSEIFELLPEREAKWFLKKIIDEGLFEQRTSTPCPYFELNMRRNRAQLIAKLSMVKGCTRRVRERAIRELYLDLPEATDIADIQRIRGFNAVFSRLKPMDFLRRIQTLLTFGKNLEARSTLTEVMKGAKKMSPAELCELRYADAKIDRRMRKYKDARTKFQSIIGDQCPEDTKRNARYSDLAIATAQGGQEGFERYDDFVARYPKHSLTDDVLMFKAGLLLDRERYDEALQVLGEVISAYPEGDMIDRALFMRGFNWAKLGNAERALVDMAELMRKSAPGSENLASAKYWSARLMVFNDPRNLLHPHIDNLEAARKSLLELARDGFPTIYSWLAKSLLESMGEKAVRLPPPQYSKIALPLTIDKAGDLEMIGRLAESGFRREALCLLDELPLGSNEVDRAAMMAVLYDALNRPERGHQRLARCDKGLSNSLQMKIPEVFSRISYPQSFSKDADVTLARVDVPRHLILAVMRQESGFIEHACSWAGAKGLMQLMLRSAKPMAKAFGIERLVEADLYLPGLNILLGSALLKGYWERFGDPIIALAAYNAGPTAAKAWQKKNIGIPLDTFIEDIPFKETRAYVKSVLGAAYEYAMRDGRRFFIKVTY